MPHPPPAPRAGLRALLPAALLALASPVLMATVALAPPERGMVLAWFGPIAAEQAALRAMAADAVPVISLAGGVVATIEPGGIARLRAAGAILVLNAAALRGCFARTS
ncbi:hypothetical protein FK498_13825 [Elioraea sp. Yellowstone]|jgi:hypothetical protein|uniref:hypothetical protein n=1 Tax=Elioraea sp. Yellowstone TaxID=2592070 RepID=UPI00115453BA|nr:hypothetical protein [Elioraea sp. Yellowstone]TQF77205.1 hypothetical protein FK498_13825 [Elioraea sp. Yellowstone]